MKMCTRNSPSRAVLATLTSVIALACSGELEGEAPAVADPATTVEPNGMAPGNGTSPSDPSENGPDPQLPGGPPGQPSTTATNDPGAPGTESPNPSTQEPVLDPTSPEAANAMDAVPGTSRALRLAGPDLDRVLSDLLGLDVSVAGNFPEEIPTLNGYFENASLTVNDRYKTELTLTAEALAQQVVDDQQAYAFVVGCEPSDAACRESFVENFVRRAYRRPASASEKDSYLSLFDSAAGLIQSGDDFTDGVQLVVEAALQSPKFLYRVEQGSGVDDEFGTVLTPYEIASRLSFMYWGTMPDEPLFEAAATGALGTAQGIETQANRLASDARVAERVVDFHQRWLQTMDLAGVSKDAELFPEFDAGLVESMREEMRQFVRGVSLDGDGGIRELLTAPEGYVDQRLATLYGIDGSFSDQFTRVEYGADSPRAGLLTQAAFLTGHTSSARTTSPILRGVFVLARLTCFKVPEPPPNATSMEPPEPATPPATTRELFTWKTSLPSCATCHDVINPIGFAFEAFDPVGRHRTQENGAPVDPSGESFFPERFSFADAKGFLSQLAPLPDTRACYASNWLQYAFGRDVASEDLKTLSDLTTAFDQPGFGARDVLLRLTQSAAFTHIQGQP